MRKYIRVVLFAFFFVTLFFIFKSFYREEKIVLKDSSMDFKIMFKGLENARDFVIGEDSKYYIAYKDKIQVIHSDGKSFDVFTDKSLNINSLEYKSGKLYFISNNDMFYYDLDKGEKKLLIGNLPNIGDYNSSIIKLRGEEIFISIGAMTNSGVVGSDNEWLSQKPFNYDLSPKSITLKGKSFGDEKTGAFVPYKTKNIDGQIIPGHFPGNSSIIRYNISTGNYDNFVWGLRNVTGMSFNSEGKLITAVGGMEDRGLRPVKGDIDYIYEIKEGLWYGWPDYSGGDPISSPRFKNDDGKSEHFILENHPTTNPPAPFYQHKYLSSLGALEVDFKAVLDEKDCIYFFDRRDNIVYALKKTGSLSDKIILSKGSDISSIRICKDGLMILEKNNGILYKIYRDSVKGTKSLNINIYYYLLVVVLAGIILSIWKLSLSNKKSS